MSSVCCCMRFLRRIHDRGVAASKGAPFVRDKSPAEADSILLPWSPSSMAQVIGLPSVLLLAWVLYVVSRASGTNSHAWRGTRVNQAGGRARRRFHPRSSLSPGRRGCGDTESASLRRILRRDSERMSGPVFTSDREFPLALYWNGTSRRFLAGAHGTLTRSGIRPNDRPIADSRARWSGVSFLCFLTFWTRVAASHLHYADHRLVRWKSPADGR